jgi:hypothetical protein
MSPLRMTTVAFGKTRVPSKRRTLPIAVAGGWAAQATVNESRRRMRFNMTTQ